MDTRLTKIAQTCLDGAESNAMTFPQIVGTLMQEGFESYAVDFRRATATYFLPDGDSLVLPTCHGNTQIAGEMDTGAVQAAIREAQQLAPGYTYAGFCTKVMAAGCAGYIVSFTGRRVVYPGARPRRMSSTFHSSGDNLHESVIRAGGITAAVNYPLTQRARAGFREPTRMETALTPRRALNGPPGKKEAGCLPPRRLTAALAPPAPQAHATDSFPLG